MLKLPMGGIYLYEQGTPDVGRAHAGSTAIASDASTAGKKPCRYDEIRHVSIEGHYPANAGRVNM